MHKSFIIGALSGVLLYATAAGAAEQAAKPTDPQIANIAYTAGQLDIEAAKQALDNRRTRMSAPLPSRWSTTIRR
jgi:predicted outer membrane protein